MRTFRYAFFDLNIYLRMFPCFSGRWHDAAGCLFDGFVGYIEDEAVELAHDFLGIGEFVFYACNVRVVGCAGEAERFHAFASDGIEFCTDQ